MGYEETQHLAKAIAAGRAEVIEAPSTTTPEPWRTSVFLAGGITDCPDWQADLIETLAYRGGLALLNPRQPNFDVRDPNASDAQVEWEAKRLKDADAISFWFPEETLCPITLYELGGWSRTDIPLIVGCHPNYARRFDVVKQTSIYRPDVIVTNSLIDGSWSVAKQIAAL